MKFEKKIGKNNLDRSKLLKRFITIIYLIIVIRIFYMQIIKYNYFNDLSKQNVYKKKIIVGTRGNIYDSNGVVLVKNIQGYKLVYLNGKKYNDVNLKNIVKLLNLKNKESAIKLINKGVVDKYTKDNVIYNDLSRKAALELLENKMKYSALDVVLYPKREYKYPKSTSDILGYVKVINGIQFKKFKSMGYNIFDFIGEDGIEKYYDKLLRGQDGLEEIEVNAFDKEEGIKKVHFEKKGNDLVLGIDYRLQNYMMQCFKNKIGVFIAMEAKTGKIITMINSPEYDSNIMSGTINIKTWNNIINNPGKPLNNEVVRGEYPPGSVYKPVVALAFLNKGISPNYQIFDSGYFDVGGRRFKNWNSKGEGNIAMIRAIARSCDTYFYKLSYELGSKCFIDISQKFGFGKLTKIDLPGEKKGLLPNAKWKRENKNEIWYKGDTVNLSIGQGYLLTTPIQILEEFDILANSGIAYRPHILQAIIGDDKTIYKINPQILRVIKLKKDYWQVVQKGLRATAEASEGGTARFALSFKKLKVAAKTGSAQNSHYQKPHSWLAGYFPYKNPKIIFVSLVAGGGEGSVVSGPIVRKFIKKYYELKGKKIN